MWPECCYINGLIQESLDEATDPWGIKVERVEIKDVKLPHQLQRAMAAEAEASREARAKVIMGDIIQYPVDALWEATWMEAVLGGSNHRD